METTTQIEKNKNLKALILQFDEDQSIFATYNKDEEQKPKCKVMMTMKTKCEEVESFVETMMQLKNET